MGKTWRWFRALFGAKITSDSSPASPNSRPAKEKSNWGFIKYYFNGNGPEIGGARGSHPEAEAIDANKRAIAMAAVAEVVRLTSGGGRRPPETAHVSDQRWESAAVKIQSAFRACLARRALRALKALVKLQALVRGHIVRKQSADMLRRMQALARIQARACANRAHMSDTGHSRSNYYKSRNPRPRKTKDIAYLQTTPSSSNWLDQWIELRSWNSQGCTSQETGYADDKILEVDTWKPHLYSTPERNYNDHGVTKSEKRKNPSISSVEASSIRSLKFPTGVDQAAAWSSENGPREWCASWRPKSTVRKRTHLSPARSNCSRSFFGDYPAYPNYMANTESSLARFRSQSVPKQRMPVIEKVGSTKRFVRGFWDADTISEMGSTKSYGGRF